MYGLCAQEGFQTKVFNNRAVCVLKEKKKLENLHSSAKHTHKNIYKCCVFVGIFKQSVIYQLPAFPSFLEERAGELWTAYSIFHDY